MGNIKVTIYSMPAGSDHPFKAVATDGKSEARTVYGDSEDQAKTNAIATFKAEIPQVVSEKHYDLATGEVVNVGRDDEVGLI